MQHQTGMSGKQRLLHSFLSLTVHIVISTLYILSTNLSIHIREFTQRVSSVLSSVPCFYYFQSEPFKTGVLLFYCLNIVELPYLSTKNKNCTSKLSLVHTGQSENLRQSIKPPVFCVICFLQPFGQVRFEYPYSALSVLVLSLSSPLSLYTRLHQTRLSWKILVNNISVAYVLYYTLHSTTLVSLLGLQC